MPLLALDITEIADLSTQIASGNRHRELTADSDKVFEYLIPVARLIHQSHPQI